MISFRAATSAFHQPGQPIRASTIIAQVSPLTERPASLTRLARLLNRGGPVARLGGRYAKIVNKLDLSSDGLVGLADLHTHPAANLGFGTNFFFGPPDGDPSQVFNECKAYHGSWGLTDNPHGNVIRNAAVDAIAGTEFADNWVDAGVGFPEFPQWPTWHDRLHQQVRVEMLERAWQGGLRVLVAHAVNSHTLAVLGQTLGPCDDKSAGDLQIAAIKNMVAGQAFMELALSPADLRAIVGRGHLAVIIGVELDCLGNFYQPLVPGSCNAPFDPMPTDDAIRAEVARLHDAGVRYVFPVHLTDNVFGGAALYEMAFDAANRFQFGSFYQAETAPAESDIGFHLDQTSLLWDTAFAADAFAQALTSMMIGGSPRPAQPPPPHINSRGLQPAGEVLLDALMARGMMIDVDHMGEKTVRQTLAHTEPLAYPVFAGHCGIRPVPPPAIPPTGNERSHQISDATTILQRGGMWGVGIKSGLEVVSSTIQQLRQASPTSGGLAFGSDCSGLEQLPAPRYDSGKPVALNSLPDTFIAATDAQAHNTVEYRDYAGAKPDALERCHLGNRRESIYFGGFSHIGMYPDFLEDGVSSVEAGGAPTLSVQALQDLFRGPEALARAWETCLAVASRVPAPQPG